MLSFFHKIVDVLNELEIPYMLSGSVAMGVYIVPRATRDFDFVIYMQPKEVKRFADQFQEGYYCNADAIKDAVKHQSLFNILDHASGFKADFVILKNEEFRQEEFSRRVQMDYFGKSIYIVSVEDLLLSKLIWIQQLQSALQVEDIRNLCRLNTIDWHYVKKWIVQLNLRTFELIKK